MGEGHPRLPRLRPGCGSLGRIDALGWRAGKCFGAYGLRVGVRTNTPALLERLAVHFPPGWQARRSPLVDLIFSVWVDPLRDGQRTNRVYAGRRRCARTADLDQALAVLESELRQAVAAGAARRTFVHAGVVGWKGRAIVLPGRSRSGKTTLVAELVGIGAQYLSDEFAVLDRRGRAHPFLKPLSIRGPGGCDLHARARRAEDLGGTCATQPLPVGLVVFAEHRPGARWRPERLTPGRAVLEMLAHTVPARLRPDDSLLALERAVRGATVLKGERGEARDLAPLLLQSWNATETTSHPGTGRMGTKRGVRRTPCPRPRSGATRRAGGSPRAGGARRSGRAAVPRRGRPA